MGWCREYVGVIDEVYGQIDTLANTKGHIARIPTILYKVLLKVTSPEIECLEVDEVVEMDQDELIKMIREAHGIVHREEGVKS